MINLRGEGNSRFFLWPEIIGLEPESRLAPRSELVMSFIWVSGDCCCAELKAEEPIFEDMALVAGVVNGFTFLGVARPWRCVLRFIWFRFSPFFSSSPVISLAFFFCLSSSTRIS